MNKLIINTANDKLFIVLQKENNVFSFTSENNVHHNEIIIPKIDELLTKHDLKIEDIDELGVVVGPGSFTGIRVGIATIKGIRDALKIKAKGINNLDYLFALASKDNNSISTVAIKGSNNSYFVAKMIHNQVYKYERNLTLNELNEVAENKSIGMFKTDEELNCRVFGDDAEVLLDCFEKSNDEKLIPVYYQLSQAENEKLKRGELKILKANKKDVNKIYEIEKSNIISNTLSLNDIKTANENESYLTYKAVFNGEIVGFIILQITDEINIVSVAVNKQFRNLGIASKLITKAQEVAKKLKIKTVSLEVNFNNITAFLLYQKLGFVLRRERKNYYEDGSSALEMIKQL